METRTPPRARVVFALALVVLSGPAAARTAERPERIEEVFATRPEALREAFPNASRIEETEVILSRDEKLRIEKRIRRRLFEDRLVIYRGRGEDGEVSDYAVITEEIGKFRPITFIVVVTPESDVREVSVLVYRETVGSEVRRRRFLSQFRGKSTRARLQVHRDVINVAGATYSSRAIARGVKKVLHAVHELVISDRRRESLEWKEVPLEEDQEDVTSRGAVPLRRMAYLMGTVLEIRCWGAPGEARAAMREAFREVARLEGLLSTFRPRSDISRVNIEAPLRPVRVSSASLECVAAALEVARKTGGAFDPTLRQDGYRSVLLDTAAREIRFARDGVRLDLGGIGKGYALDRAADVLEKRGIRRALLNFGGQILALDAPPGRSGWPVALRDPGAPSSVLGWIEVRRLSVSTSASYERGAHIVNPSEGHRETDVLGAVVCAPSATEADGLSTALHVLGPSGVPRMLGREGPRLALVVTRHGGIREIGRTRDGPVLLMRDGALEGELLR